MLLRICNYELQKNNEPQITTDSLIKWLTNCLAGWLTDWQTDRMSDSLHVCFLEYLTVWPPVCLPDSPTDCMTEWLTDSVFGFQVFIWITYRTTIHFSKHPALLCWKSGWTVDRREVECPEDQAPTNHMICRKSLIWRTLHVREASKNAIVSKSTGEFMMVWYLESRISDVFFLP